MIRVDCSELSGEAKLALASAVSDRLEGRGIGLLRGDDVVVDYLSGRRIEVGEVLSMVNGFISDRPDASSYGVERKGDAIVVHSTEPVPTDKKKTSSMLPSGFLQCPVCGFMTTSKGKYDTHTRLHDLMRGLAR